MSELADGVIDLGDLSGELGVERLDRLLHRLVEQLEAFIDFCSVDVGDLLLLLQLLLEHDESGIGLFAFSSAILVHPLLHLLHLLLEHLETVVGLLSVLVLDSFVELD